MVILAVTANGQITLPKELLEHAGVTPSGQIEVTAPPDGWIEIKAARPAGSANKFIRLLAGRTRRIATIEELTETTTRAWAGRE